MSGTLSLSNNANGVEISSNVGGNVAPVETQSMDIEVSTHCTSQSGKLSYQKPYLTIYATLSPVGIVSKFNKC